MNLNKLYEIAEKEKIKIYDWHFEDIDGIYLNYDKINAIALNYDEFGTYIDEKCTLAEELGHYFMDASYSLYADSQTIERQEYRAKKWQFLTLAPPPIIQSMVAEGYSFFEIAEKLEITEDVLLNAYNYYIENNILEINA